MAVCTITSRSHGNGKTDIGLSNLDMPTKRVSFSHSPTTAIMKNVYLLTEVNNNAETGKRKYAVSTGESLSEALLFAEHGENMLCTKIVLNVRNNFCTQHVLPMF